MKLNQAFTVLQNAGGIRAARVITENTKNLSKIKIFFIACALRRGVPVAKIIHQKWFFGLSFYTNAHTLDPRPDTETLVSAVIGDCVDVSARKILDVGTGTGCIIVSLVKNIQKSAGVAMDKSRGALRVARRNVAAHDLRDSVSVVRGDFNCARTFAPDSFDIIVSNPPYIVANDGRVNTGALHDPKIALYAKNNGLAAYESIARNARTWLRRGGRIYLEIGAGQDAAVKKIFMDAGWGFVRADADLAGIIRVLIFDKV